MGAIGTPNAGVNGSPTSANGFNGSKKGIAFEELWTGRPCKDRLAEYDLDIGDLIIRKNLLAAHRRVLGILAGVCPRYHAYPGEKSTRFLPTSAKRMGSIVVHLRSTESKYS